MRAQPVALDLPGGGLGQLGDRDDLARPLERREPRPAERDDVGLVDRGVGHGDDVGHRLVEPVLVRHADDDGLGHRRVLEDARLHLGGAHPDAADLQHVVARPMQVQLPSAPRT